MVFPNMWILYLQYSGINRDYHVILTTVSLTTDLCYLLLQEVFAFCDII